MPIVDLSNKGRFAISTDNGATWKEFVAKSISHTYESLASADSGRTDDGLMHISWVRRKIRKFSITMPPMKYSDIADNTKNPLMSVQGLTYKLKIYDITMAEGTPSAGNIGLNYTTIDVYTSNSLAECYSGVLYDGLWQGVLFSAIEV